MPSACLLAIALVLRMGASAVPAEPTAPAHGARGAQALTPSQGARTQGSTEPTAAAERGEDPGLASAAAPGERPGKADEPAEPGADAPGDDGSPGGTADDGTASGGTIDGEPPDGQRPDGQLDGPPPDDGEPPDEGEPPDGIADGSPSDEPPPDGAAEDGEPPTGEPADGPAVGEPEDDEFGDDADAEPWSDELDDGDGDGDGDTEPLPEYDPLRDSPQALAARHWVRTGIVSVSVGGALFLGAVLMGASDPCNLAIGNSCQPKARNRAALVMGIPAGVLIGGGVAALVVGTKRKQALAVDLQASRDRFGLGVRGRF